MCGQGDMTSEKIGCTHSDIISLHQTKHKCFMEEELIEEVIEDFSGPGPLTILFQMVPPWILSVFTILLVAILFCGWKAPRWVRPLGSIALAFSFIPCTWKILIALYDVKMAGAVSPNAWYSCFNISSFIITLGMMVFLISRIIIAIQSTRN